MLLESHVNLNEKLLNGKTKKGEVASPADSVLCDVFIVIEDYYHVTLVRIKAGFYLSQNKCPFQQVKSKKRRIRFATMVAFCLVLNIGVNLKII